MELKFVENWSPDYAKAKSSFILNDRHFEVIRLARLFYATYTAPLALKAFIPYVKNHTKQDFSSITMIELFGEQNPLLALSILAGLPKPLGCL